jgi:hypothetical protein
MALWKIRNNHYYGPVGDRHKLPKISRKLIKKPWVAVYVGPDYNDAKEVGRFKTWQEALEYVRLGGTPYVVTER